MSDVTAGFFFDLTKDGVADFVGVTGTGVVLVLPAGLVRVPFVTGLDVFTDALAADWHKYGHRGGPGVEGGGVEGGVEGGREGWRE
jgi:hypothetical protein